MAKLKITFAIKTQWTAEDRLRILRGSENAMDLASSTPAGGRVIHEVAVPVEQDSFSYQFEYQPDNKCAWLPLGAAVVDAAGNQSMIAESLAPMHDPPRGARDLVITPTGTPGEATLTWTQSPDLNV